MNLSLLAMPCFASSWYKVGLIAYLSVGGPRLRKVD